MAELIFPTGFDEKTTIAQDDMILMADSEDSNKIKKAKYSNLKGEKGDPGQDGQDGQDGTDGASIVSGSFVGNDLVFTKDDSNTVTIENAKTTLQGPEGDEGPEGPEGPAGNGIASITSSKNGKITTVTITETNGDSESFTVSDGADGQGVGDVVGPNSSTDGNLVVFDGVTGKLIKDGSVSLATLSAGASAGATAVQPGDIGTAAACNTGTSSGNVPVLDSNGKLATSTLPGVALTDTFTVSTSADLITLSSAEQGDIAIVSSENKTYVLSVAPYSTASNWKEILSPTGGVTSVNTQTGAVTVNDVKVAAAAPASPTEGMTWYDTANDKLKSYDGANWNVVGDGDVTGPASSTDGHLAVFDGATGKIIKDGGAVPEQNVKIFTLSSTSDLVNAQAAYDWYANGGVPIVNWGIRQYRVSVVNSTFAYFSTTQTNNVDNLNTYSLRFVLSSGTVTGITEQKRSFVVGTALPSTPDVNTIYFIK